jgi:O-antigen/teichoic acid export membrane protein
MKRVFASNLVLLLSLNILVKPFWIFGIDRTVQNVVGAGEYGLFFSMFNFSLLLNIVLDLGLTNFNNREISRHSQLLTKYLSNIVGIRLTLAVLYMGLSFGLAVVLKYSGRQLVLLSMLVFNQFLASFILYLRSNLSGLQLFKADSIISVLDRFTMIVLCSLLLWGNVVSVHFTIEWFIFTQTVSYLVTLAVAFTIVVRRTSRFRLTFDRGFTISMLRQSFPYALLMMLMTIYSRVDSVIIERVLPSGDVETGIYAQAFRLLDAANMYPFLFAGLLLPIFSCMIKEKTPVHSLIGFAFALLMVPAIAFSVSGFVFSQDLMGLLYHSHVQDSAKILSLLMVSFVFISLNYIFGTLLTANGSIWQLNYISLVGVLVCLTLNLLLVPRFRALGAAYSSIVTHGVVAILQFIMAYKAFRFSVAHIRYLQFFGFIVGSMGLAVVVRILQPNWIVGFVGLFAGSILIGILSRLIRVGELLSFLKSD